MTAPVIFGTLSGIGVAVSSALEEHTFSLPTVGSVFIIVFTGVWWLSRKFTQIDDRADTVAGQLKETQAVFAAKLVAIETKIDALPCRHPSCMGEPPDKPKPS